jgi:hypothetical protein
MKTGPSRRPVDGNNYRPIRAASKSAVTYVVPFVVSNLGVLVASRVDRHDGARA